MNWISTCERTPPPNMPVLVYYTKDGDKFIETVQVNNSHWVKSNGELLTSLPDYWIYSPDCHVWPPESEEDFMNKDIFRNYAFCIQLLIAKYQELMESLRVSIGALKEEPIESFFSNEIIEGYVKNILELEDGINRLMGVDKMLDGKQLIDNLTK